MRRAAALLCMALACAMLHAQPDEGPVLRVCADPDNLPYSHMDGSGFENRIARLLAQELGWSLQYAWLPDRRGFVRKTMGAGLCDVIVGVPVGFERAALTQPYYRSRYVWLQRADAGRAPAGFDDPRLARMRIGVQLIGNDLAASPPGYALARHAAGAQVVGFPVPGEEPAGQRIAAAVARGELDGAVLWGPQAGYFARHTRPPLRLSPIAQPADLQDQPFEFAIAAGVKNGDAALRARIGEALQRRRTEIDAILAEYGVPRSDGEQRP